MTALVRRLTPSERREMVNLVDNDYRVMFAEHYGVPVVKPKTKKVVRKSSTTKSKKPTAKKKAPSRKKVAATA